MSNKRWMDAAEVARHVRCELKVAWPGVKFSVRCSNYSGGSSVYIRWTDGPRVRDVQRAVGFLEGRSFDGRDDSTHYHPVTLRSGEVVSSGSYISETRDISPALNVTLDSKLREVTGLDPFGPAVGGMLQSFRHRLSWLYDDTRHEWIVGDDIGERKQAEEADFRISLGLTELHRCEAHARSLAAETATN